MTRPMTEASDLTTASDLNEGGSSADADTHRDAETPVVPGHTPGPWRVATDNAVAGPEDGFNPIGACGCCNSPWMMADDKATQEADARLIAAAPRMFDYIAIRAAAGDTEATQIMESLNANP